MQGRMQEQQGQVQGKRIMSRAARWTSTGTGESTTKVRAASVPFIAAASVALLRGWSVVCAAASFLWRRQGMLALTVPCHASRVRQDDDGGGDGRGRDRELTPALSATPCWRVRPCSSVVCKFNHDWFAPAALVQSAAVECARSWSAHRWCVFGTQFPAASRNATFQPQFSPHCFHRPSRAPPFKLPPSITDPSSMRTHVRVLQSGATAAAAAPSAPAECSTFRAPAPLFSFSWIWREPRSQSP